MVERTRLCTLLKAGKVIRVKATVDAKGWGVFAVVFPQVHSCRSGLPASKAVRSPLLVYLTHPRLLDLRLQIPYRVSHATRMSSRQPR
eukprot:920661-Pyramimonas_sp.AAC.1